VAATKVPDAFKEKVKSLLPANPAAEQQMEPATEAPVLVPLNGTETAS
jgi:hypothetical protein